MGQGDNYTKNLSGERIGFVYFLLQQEIKTRLNRTHEAKLWCNPLFENHTRVNSCANELSYITIGGSQCLIVSE